MEQMLENPGPTSCPPGSVPRRFSMKERQLIVLACQVYSQNGDFKKQRKLRDIRLILKADEVEDYFDTIREKEHDLLSEWTKASNMYRRYQAWKAGSESQEEILKAFPDMDLKDPAKAPKKPSFVEPEIGEKDIVGPDADFFIPAKVEVFIEAALKKMTWGTFDCSYVATLAEKYSLPEDED